MGSKMYPAGTNHFSPYSPLFKKEQRKSIPIRTEPALSDINLILLNRNGNLYL